jgi:Zn-dependent M32 family carboxypeptidase
MPWGEVRRAGLAAESDEASLIRVARRDYTQATALPESFVEEKARTAALARAAWEDARSADDFAAFAPRIEQRFNLARHNPAATTGQDPETVTLAQLFAMGWG